MQSLKFVYPRWTVGNFVGLCPTFCDCLWVDEAAVGDLHRAIGEGDQFGVADGSALVDLAARAGYDPRAGVALWQKMETASKGAPPAWLSTHPSGQNRIAEISKHLPEVMPLYAQAKSVPIGKLAPYKTNWSDIAAVN